MPKTALSASADPMSPNALDSRGLKVGVWTEDDPHGGTISGEYVDGERHGHWTHFAVDGSVRSEFVYEAGELNGACVWFRVTGGLLQRGGFRAGEKHGLWERWTANGVLIDSGEWSDGQKSGSWTYYHPDGSVKKTTVHRPR